MKYTRQQVAELFAQHITVSTWSASNPKDLYFRHTVTKNPGNKWKLDYKILPFADFADHIEVNPDAKHTTSDVFMRVKPIAAVDVFAGQVDAILSENREANIVEMLTDLVALELDATPATATSKRK